MAQDDDAWIDGYHAARVRARAAADLAAKLKLEERRHFEAQAPYFWERTTAGFERAIERYNTGPIEPKAYANRPRESTFVAGWDGDPHVSVEVYFDVEAEMITTTWRSAKHGGNVGHARHKVVANSQGDLIVKEAATKSFTELVLGRFFGLINGGC